MEPGAPDLLRAGTLAPLSLCPPKIPDHELLKLIGRGSYGEVWLARNIMGSYRAVKVVYRDTFDHERPYEREFEGIKKFEPISRRHPSQVNILHMGREDGCFYYVMELADSATGGGDEFDVENYRPRTLKSELDRRGPLPVAECIEIGLALSTSLAHLHSHGLVHRDIKPSNIIYINGLPKLADIGLVSALDATRSHVGTIGFAPPEGPGTPEADIYSLGKVLYEASTSRDRQEFPELPTQLSLNVEEHRALLEFNEILLKACEGQPSRRYQTAEAMHEDLLLLRSGQSLVRVRQTQKRFAAARRFGGFAVVVAIVLGAAFSYQTEQTRKVEELAKRNNELAVEARSKAEGARARLVDLQVNNGVRLMNEGESGHALLWFTEALKSLDQNSKERAEHRLRIGLLLDSFPAPVIFGRETGPPTGSFSPDGRKLVLSIQGGNEKAGVILDAESGAVLSRLSLTNAQAIQSQTGRVFVSFDGNAAWSWDPASGRPLAGPMLHPAEIRLLALSDDDRLCATASADRIVRIWDAITGTLMAETSEHSNEVRCLAFSRDGLKLASGDGRGALSFLDDAGSVRVWSTEDGRPLSDWLKEEGTLHALRFSRDAQHLLTSVELGGRVVVDDAWRGANLWKISSGRIFARFEHKDFVRDADFSPDGRFLATASLDRTVATWKSANGERIGSPLQHDEPVDHVRFSPDMRLLATVSRATVQVWDLPTRKRALPPLRHNDRVISTTFSPNGRLLYTGSSDGTYRVWNLSTERTSRPNLHTGEAVAGAAFDPHGTLAVACSTRGYIVAMDLKSGKIIEFGERNVGDWGVVPMNPAFSPDGGKIVVPWYENLVRTWEISTGEEAAPPLVHNGIVAAAVPSPDGSLIATLSGDKGGSELLSIWDAASYALVTSIREDEGMWLLPKFSPDSKALAVRGGLSERLRIWDARSGKPAGPNLDFEGVSCFDYSPDGRWLVLGLRTGEIVTCDLTTGKAVGEALRHKSPVFNFNLSPDGRMLLSVSADNAARLWDLGYRTPVHTFQHRNRVLSATFNKDASLVVTTCADGTALVWSASSGQALSGQIVHTKPVHTGVFSPDDRHLLTACADCAQIIGLPDIESETESLVERSEFLAGARLNKNLQIEPLSAEDSQQTWPRLEKSFRVSASKVHDIQWHVRGLEHALQQNDLFAADHHKLHLSALSPSHSALARPQPEVKTPAVWPKRDAAAQPGELDLSSFYNASAEHGWHGDRKHGLRFPAGLHQGAGVRFDARGLVQVSATSNSLAFPSKVLGIPAGQKASKLHVLHSSCVIAPGSFEEGAECARYVLHFKGGRTQVLPVILGRHVNDWWSETDKPEPLPESEIAWTGMNESSRARGRALQLYKTTYDIHFKEAELAEIDIVAIHPSQSLFVLAITLE